MRARLRAISQVGARLYTHSTAQSDTRAEYIALCAGPHYVIFINAQAATMPARH